MISDADQQYLRIVYRRLDRLMSAAVTDEQCLQAEIARDRTTAELHLARWKLTDIGGALQVPVGRVRRWNARGQQHLKSLRRPSPEPLAPQPVLSPEGHLSIPQAALWLQVQPQTVYRWVRQGMLPGTRRDRRDELRWTIECNELAKVGITGPMWTADDIAATFDVTRATALRWMRNGALPVVHLGRLTRSPADHLPRWC